MQYPVRCHAVSQRHCTPALLAVLVNFAASLALAGNAPHASTRLLRLDAQRLSRSAAERGASHSADSELVAGRGAENAVTYGPGNCISLWQNEHGHCAISTKCQEEDDIASYPVKLICEKDGEKVRHVFAEGSFAQEEEFDTLIACSTCAADVAGDNVEEDELEEEPTSAALKDLRTQLQNLTDGMVKQSDALHKLNAKVFNIKVEVEEDASGAPAAEAEAVLPKSLVHHGATRHHRLQKAAVVFHRRVPKPQPPESDVDEADESEHQDAPVAAPEERLEDTVASRLAQVAAPTAKGVISAASTLRQLATTWATEAAAAATSASSARPLRLLRGFAGEDAKEKDAPKTPSWSLATEIRRSEEGAALLQKNRRSRRISHRDDRDESDEDNDELVKETIADEEEAAAAEAEMLGAAGAAELAEARDTDIPGNEDVGTLETASEESLPTDDAASTVDQDDSSEDDLP